MYQRKALEKTEEIPETDEFDENALHTPKLSRRRASSFNRGKPDKYTPESMAPFLEITKSRRQSLSTSALHQIKKPSKMERRSSIIMNLMPKPTQSLKLVLIGDRQVGKSAFMVKLVTNRFITEYCSESDNSATYNMTSDDDERVKLHITDPANIGKSNNSWLNAVKSNEIVLLLFDISNFDSFQWIVDRAHLIHQLKKIPPSVILIGTKFDLDWKREVEAEDGYQLAEHFKWQYVEISAADQSIADHNLVELVQSIVSEYLVFKKYSTQGKKRSSVQKIIRKSFHHLGNMLLTKRRPSEIPLV